ncbi:hypothetical protein FXO38_16613 [Capsicum annuum]|nr:hypothetical protein FXO38_16613 [Capsicum annuum]
MYKYSNTTESTPTWTAMEPDRNLPLLHPFVFAFGRKIYVICGHEPVIYINHEDNTDLTYPDASSEEKDVEKKGQWRLPTYFTAIGVIGAVAFVAVAYGFYKKAH